jgi:hypothetical protein
LRDKQIAEVMLNAAIPWRIGIQGGGSGIVTELAGLDLTGLEVKAGGSMIHLNLPSPSRAVSIKVSGGGSEIVVRRPAGVAARIHVKGWGSSLSFDGQTLYNPGNDVRMESPEYEPTSPGYDIDVLSSTSMVTVTSG